MYRTNLLALLKEELETNNGYVSTEFLQKIRDIGPVTEYALAEADRSRQDFLGDCPTHKEDLSKVRTIEDFFTAIDRLKVFSDSHMPKDI